MSKRGLQQRIADEIRRRQKRPPPKAVSLAPLSTRQREALTNSHATLLLGIELSIFNASKADPEINDETVLHALRSALLQEECAEPSAQLVLDSIRSASEQYLRVSGSTLDPQVIQDALRVILESVRTHKDVAWGDRNYLTFLEGFLQQASEFE